jgi:UrcA family protein
LRFGSLGTEMTLKRADAKRSMKIGLAIAALLCLTACAHPLKRDIADGQATDFESMKVPIGDLDLETAAGRGEARKRIERAARQLCHRFHDSSSVSYREDQGECIRAAVETALKSLPPYK